jgi:hypothetical protein
LEGSDNPLDAKPIEVLASAAAATVGGHSLPLVLVIRFKMEAPVSKIDPIEGKIRRPLCAQEHCSKTFNTLTQRSLRF